MYFKNQKFLVAGMSKSGIAGAEFLLSRGAAVYMYDDVADGAVLACDSVTCNEAPDEEAQEACVKLGEALA